MSRFYLICYIGTRHW